MKKSSVFTQLKFVLGSLAYMCAMHTSFAASSIMIWPIDPVIESDQRAAALWLENRGTTPANLQLRVFGWQQDDGQDVYFEQSDVLGSPPVIRIASGQKQLVRLTRTSAVPPDGTEQAYRILVDEIPVQREQNLSSDEPSSSAGISFQMRYSIPLFVYGKGLTAQKEVVKDLEQPELLLPNLRWRLVEHKGKRMLEVRNDGAKHIRLADVFIRYEKNEYPLSENVLGYILANSRVYWPVSDMPVGEWELNARINGSKAFIAIPNNVDPLIN